MAAPPPAAGKTVINLDDEEDEFDLPPPPQIAVTPAASSPAAPKRVDQFEDDEQGRSFSKTEFALLNARRDIKHCISELSRQETNVAETASAVDGIAAIARSIIPPADLDGLFGEARLSRTVERLERIMQNVTTMPEAATLRSQAASAMDLVVKELTILDEMKTQFEAAVKTLDTLLLEDLKKSKEDFTDAFSRLTDALQSAKTDATASTANLDTVKVRGWKEIEDTVATLTPFLTDQERTFQQSISDLTSRMNQCPAADLRRDTIAQGLTGERRKLSVIQSYRSRLQDLATLAASALPPAMPSSAGRLTVVPQDDLAAPPTALLESSEDAPADGSGARSGGLFGFFGRLFGSGSADRRPRTKRSRSDDELDNGGSNGTTGGTTRPGKGTTGDHEADRSDDGPEAGQEDDGQ